MALFLNYTQKKFGQDKRDTLTRFCRECDLRFAGNGGCPKDRFATSPHGEPGQHHLCPGYQDFFHHVREPMEAMMLLLRCDARGVPSTRGPSGGLAPRRG
jgi:uncharacterized protein